jgi:hypothetical protein
MKKKIALCLHGYFNSSRDTSSLGVDGYNHIQKHILQNNDVDVYIHSWDLDNAHLIDSLYKSITKNRIIEPQIDFKPLFQRNNLHTYPIREGATPFWNVFSQFYSVQKSFELMIESGVKYDCIIKSRFDLGRINRNTSGPGLGNPFPVQCINFSPEYNMNGLYMADWQYLDSEGPADMWFYGNAEIMNNFSKVFDIIADDVKIGSEYQQWAGENDGGLVNTIKAWKWFMVKTGIWERKITLETVWE